MASNLTDKTFRQFIAEISDQHYTMTETVIAASAAQAAALGEVCMQISLDNQVDKLDWQDVTGRIEQMVHIKDTLLEWCNQEITSKRHVGGTNGEAVNQQELCDYSAEIGRFSVEAATMLQDFRPMVFGPLSNDLEMAINLLAGVAHATILLLDSNLYRWPDEALLQEYEPLRAEIQAQVDQLTVVDQIRKAA